MTERIYHLALRSDWETARAAGEYRTSTIGVTLEQEGFIHASFAHQVRATADRYYRDRDDVVLLVIDVDRLPSPPVVEDLGGTGEAFPHLYEPLPVEAVADVVDVPLASDGRLGLPPSVAEPPA